MSAILTRVFSEDTVRFGFLTKTLEVISDVFTGLLHLVSPERVELSPTFVDYVLSVARLPFRHGDKVM